MSENRLGHILVSQGLIKEPQLKEAIRLQKQLKIYMPLGQLLVEQRIITKEQLDFLLEKYSKRAKLGEILMRGHAISFTQLKTALEHQKKTGERLGNVLQKLNFATEEAVKRALCMHLNIPFIELDEITIDQNITKVVSKEYARNHCVIPISRKGHTITLAMNDPTELTVPHELQSFTGCIVNIVSSTRTSIQRAFKKLYEEDLYGEAGRIEMIAEEPDESVQILRYSEDYYDTKRADEIVRSLIKVAIDKRASDIHLEALNNHITTRFRIDGILQKLNVMHLEDSINTHRKAIVSRIKILGKLDIAEKRRPQDGSFRVRLEKHGKLLSFDLRIAIIPGYYGENVNLRILDQEKAPKSIEELGFSSKITKKFLQLLQSRTGIILVTGPTGSGKSSTLSGALMSLYRPGIKILTAEDPIEYVYDNISQTEVNDTIGNTFANYLRAFLRHDPEVIMIGEIRDEETAEMAFRAAQTGHLLLSTMHTNDAVTSALRLLDLGVDRNLIASSLLGVLSQRLIREICPNCKEEYQPPQNLVKEFIDVLPSDIRWYKGKGCQTCNFTGYKGRIPLGELWLPNENDILLINKGAPFEEIRASSYTSTLFMAEEAIDRLREGRTNPEELIRILPYSSLCHYRQLSLGEKPDFEQRADLLLESQLNYKLIVEDSNEIIIMAQDGKLKFANPRALELTGLSLHEIVDTPFIEIIHPEDRRQMEEMDIDILKGEKRSMSYSLRMRKENGEFFWGDFNSVKTAWEGRPATLHFIRDITKRKQEEKALQKSQEEPERRVKRLPAKLVLSKVNERLKKEINERKRAEEALRELEEKYDTLVENSLTGIYINQGGKIVFANSRFAEIYGYTKDEVTGMGAWMFVHPGDWTWVEEIMINRLEGEEVLSEYEARGLTKTGETILVRQRNTRLEYMGQPALLGNVVDVTPRKGTQEAFLKVGKPTPDPFFATPVR